MSDTITKTRILSKSSLPLSRRRIIKRKSKQISQHEVHLHNPNTILKNHQFFITTNYTTRKIAKFAHTDFLVSIAYAPLIVALYALARRVMGAKTGILSKFAFTLQKSVKL